MAEMITFSTSMMQALASFLITPPIFYLVGLICLLFIIKAIKIIIS